MPTKKEKQPLSVTHPDLAKEANGWDPSSVTFGNGKKLSWKRVLLNPFHLATILQTKQLLKRLLLQPMKSL